jgi:hypothetical protein
MFYKGIGLQKIYNLKQKLLIMGQNMQNSPQNVAVMEENLYKTMNLYIPVEDGRNITISLRFWQGR